MQVTKEQLEPTKLKLTIIADQKLLDDTRQAVLQRLSQNVKVPGFRPGKAPLTVVEKQIDQAALQSEVVEEAVNQLYAKAVEQENLRPVAPPSIALTKFVPFTTLEFSAEVEAVGDVKLPDYKKIKLEFTESEVTDEDVSSVLENLRQRGAQKSPVKRAAKDGDEVTIDFKGTDAETKEPIAGADGQDYPLVLGSGNFIPGFETEVVGLKPGATKEFVITFPKDYSVQDLQNRKAKFAVTVKDVQELQLPKLDDKFASSVGPFKKLDELKDDIKRQLEIERRQEARRQYDNQLLEKIANKSEADIPDSLIEEEIDRIEEEEKRNLVYRGQTWQEHLKEEGVTAEEHREKQREGATLRIKAGLVLGEIAGKEDVTVTPEELEIRIQLLKGQYPDEAMQKELDKPENRRDIHSRMMTEKTLDKLREYATAK
jgi:trigger factor